MKLGKIRTVPIALITFPKVMVNRMDGTIYGLTQENLSEVARIHINAFPKSALGLLGTEVVVRYYQSLMQPPHDAVALGIFEGQQLTGFCFAGLFRGALSGFLRKNRSFLFWHVFTHPWLLATPFVRERTKLALAILFRRPAGNVPQFIVPKNSFGILSIAVDPQFQGKGSGKALILEAEKIARGRKCAHVHLTVALENTPSIAFYEKMGWHRALSAEGEWAGMMVKDL